MLYLVRHGQAETPPKVCIGQTDIPLSETGTRQVFQDTLPQLKKLELSTPRLLSSPLLRTMQTAKIISDNLNIPVEQLAALKEINMGAWDGIPFSEIKQRWPEQYETRGKDFSAFRPPHGESFFDLQLRVIKALNPVCNETGSTIIVTHAGVIRTLLCAVHNTSLQNLFDYSPQTGSVTVIAKHLLKAAATSQFPPG